MIDPDPAVFPCPKCTSPVNALAAQVLPSRQAAKELLPQVPVGLAPKGCQMTLREKLTRALSFDVLGLAPDDYRTILEALQVAEIVRKADARGYLFAHKFRDMGQRDETIECYDIQKFLHDHAEWGQP